MAVLLHRKKGEQFFDNAGAMLAGGKLFYYEAGATDLQTTFSNAGGTTPNTNPLVLDGYGRLQEAVYFGDDASHANYKEILTTSANAIIPPWPMDNIPAAKAEISSQSFAALQLNWTQKTNGQSPILLTAADLGAAFECDTTAGDIEFDLPPAAQCTNKGFWFNKTSASNAVIVDPNLSETIDDSAASLVFVDKNVVIGVFSNGAEWYTIGKKETAGSIRMWPTATAPNGWLECDGSAVSRATYAALFAVLGTTYGPGNGSTTFNLPDMRGRFPRGWAHGSTADPDRASRSDRGDGTTGDNVGTKQSYQVQSHTHPLIHDPTNIQNTPSGVTGFYAFGLPDTGATGATGGNETRPVNTNLMFIIKT